MEQQKLLKIRWNTHQPNLVSYFGNLLSKESFVDVTLVSSEGKKIMCHKVILSSCSPYFQNVFESNPCKHPIVILKDVHYEDLKTIITFIYHGEVNISQDHINSILQTAASLQVKGLADVPHGDDKKVGRKRDSEVNRSILTSNSSNSGENEDSNGATLQGIQGTDIPRKKLKKAITVSGTTSISTNGEPSGGGSFESGVGASINRSVDDGSNSDTRNDSPSLRISSIQSTTPHLPGKSQSLDQLLDRDRSEAVLVDSELSSGGFSENQTFDEATMGDERAGYEIDLADVKIEADTDGEIEFDDDEEDEESYGHPHDLEFNELNQSNNQFPNIPSSSLNYQAVHHLASRVQGLKGRRLRPLLRQPRIKRLDNEPGELFIAEPENSTGNIHDELEIDIEDHNSSVPIVTVSQCSPTPPSSPQANSPAPSPPCSSNSIVISTANSTPTTSSSTSSLLMVPNIVETVAGANKISGSTFISGGTHCLVKQISDPTSNNRDKEQSEETTHRNIKYLHEGKRVIKQISQPSILPSHTTVLSTIRRQHSQPNPQSGQQHQIHHQQGTRIIPLTSASGNTIILDSNSLIQFVPISHTKDDKKDQQHGDSDAKDESSESGSVQHLTVHRAGHCPALRPGPALGCNFCWNSVDECGRILRRKTKYHCPECHINLCIVPCFQDYHQEKVEKKKARLKTPKPSSM